MKREPVRIEYIQVTDRLRSSLNEQTIMNIMESAKRVGGLLHPIAIRYADGFIVDDEEADGVPILVAGRHRLEAMRRLGETHIDCLIFHDIKTARQWEVSENLHRSDLTRQERAEHETEWVRLEEGEKPGHGVPVSTKGGRGNEAGISLAARTLPIPGKTEAAKKKHLQRSIDIATKTVPEAKQAAKDAGLADSTRALVEIAKAPADKQVEKVQEIAARKAAPRPAPAPEPAPEPAPAPKTSSSVIDSIRGAEDEWVAKMKKEYLSAPVEWRERFMFEIQAADVFAAIQK